MKTLLVVVAAAALLTLGCAPSAEGPPAVKATPTAEEEQITEMDFESGEVEQEAEGEEIAEEAPTPEAE